MAMITPSIAPGSYLGSKTVSLTFDPSIVKAEVTVNTAPPSISKYVAYDNLTPPRPAIAVSESGNSGKVVYDGGLPKFFNMNNPAAATFSDLTPAGKYLHNAIKWVANPAKVAQDSSFKILFIGDTSTTTQYHLKGVDGEGFYTAYKNIAKIAGGTSTFLDLNDYDGVKLNPTLAYLEQFACVVLLSLNFDITLPAITQSAVDAFAAYRANGNGVIINTDHGHVLNSIEDTKLVQSGNFFKTANAVAYNFGAYFTGEFDRQPVTVGYLRSNYGDHPLYKNLLDTDSIYLGLSESTISIVPSNLVNPSTIAPISLSKTGANVINVYAEDAAGNSSIMSFNYFIESTVTTPILPSVTPGYYLGPQVVSLSFDPNLVQAEVTVNAAPPSISKYIAYDDLTPPKPFIAVTEDGNSGRVVYDGGAPKFWNANNPSNAASFFELSPSGKYLYNALRWVRNPVKVIDNSFKVLVIGDMANNAYYDIKPVTTGLDGSGIAYKNIIEVAGGVATFMNLSDYDGLKLNPSASFLDQFACVILVSMNQGISLPAITEQAVAALVAYRAAGNGLVIHTDHGKDIANIEDTKLPGSGDFFKTANAVTYQFGAYFTGYYDRQPVSVGYLRQNYGDHPLYNNLTDSEFIHAGASESTISIVPNTLKPINQIAPFSLSKEGTNTINVYALDGAGNSVIKSFSYQLQIAEFLTVTSFNPTTGEEAINQSYVGSNPAGQLTFELGINTSSLGNVVGKIYLNDKLVGGFNAINGNTTLGWYCGLLKNLPVKFQDILKLEIVSPVSQTRQYQVLRREIPPLAQDFLSLPRLMAMCKQVDLFITPYPLSTANSVKALSLIVNEFAIRGAEFPQEKSLPLAVKQFKTFSRNELQVGGEIIAYIFSNFAEFTNWISTNSVALLTAYVMADTGEIYEATSTGRNPSFAKIIGLTLKDLYGAPRTLTSTTSGASKRYILRLDGSVVLV